MVSEHLKEFIIADRWTAFQKICIKNSYNYASRIIATSAALKNNIQSGFNISDEKIVLIPNPADVQSFSLRTENIEGPFTFIAIALLRQEKRLDILINAFAKLIEKMPDAVLTIVGDGPEKDNLKLLSRKLNISKRVNFTGYQRKPAVAEMLRHHHVLVLSSEVETFGVALVEAMTAGLPVIATRCGGPESIVSPETGMLVKPNDPVNLSKAMRKMIDRYSTYDPNKIRQIALEQYGDKAYVARITETISSIVQAKY
jgi:glycosyltransferase involved in cell wall biosynthesis